MTNSLTFIPSDLARAGRALTQVSCKVIGKAADLDKEQVRNFEKGNAPLSPGDNERLRRALEEYGVVFQTEDDQGGYGVRRKYNSSKIKRLETWEGEGGPAYEDDI